MTRKIRQSAPERLRHEVSWTEEVPVTSLEFIQSFQLPKTVRIIDIGGGNSKLVDFLLDEGFEDVTMLDISGTALDRARLRLGDRAAKVKWVEQDITAFQPETSFDLWHDRAAFHFLTTGDQITAYLSIARDGVKAGDMRLLARSPISGLIGAAACRLSATTNGC
jgi:trans-aconitate methyltransferase